MAFVFWIKINTEKEYCKYKRKNPPCKNSVVIMLFALLCNVTWNSGTQHLDLVSFSHIAALLPKYKNKFWGNLMTPSFLQSKTMKILTRYSRSPGRDWNPDPPEYEAGVLGHLTAAFHGRIKIVRREGPWPSEVWRPLDQWLLTSLALLPL
jgi:hypothetical protein